MSENELNVSMAGTTSQAPYDVVIIGGGPSGASAAIYAARADLKTVVVDKGLRSGALSMAGKIVNYPGVAEEVPGLELLERMRGQAEGFGTEFVQDRVLSTNLQGQVKQVVGNQGFYQGRTVIVATGSMGRTRTVPGEERLIGRGVSYCATCDGAFFREEEVAVAGDTDEALEEALFLTRFASRVHLLVPGSKLKAASDLVAEVQEDPKIEFYPSTRLKKVLGDEDVEGVEVNGHDGETRTIPVTGVFVYLQGGVPIVDFLEDELALSESGCVKVDRAMETNVSGVFAAGDVLCVHLKQVVVAAAEGARAAMSAQRYLSGRETLRPDWSA